MQRSVLGHMKQCILDETYDNVTSWYYVLQGNGRQRWTYDNWQSKSRVLWKLVGIKIYELYEHAHKNQLGKLEIDHSKYSYWYVSIFYV